MQLKRRLEALEARAPDGDMRVRVMFISFCAKAPEGAIASRLGQAIIVGDDGGRIPRNDDETEGAFARRVYGVLAAARGSRPLKGEEREILAASLSESLALAKVRGDEIKPAMIDTILKDDIGKCSPP